MPHRLSRTLDGARRRTSQLTRRIWPGAASLRAEVDDLRRTIVDLQAEIDEVRRDNVRIVELTDIVENHLVDGSAAGRPEPARSGD
ncbi:DUF6752 domain-containing protein [Cellulosimicrobium sp. NPDC057862]|uniref:DUF6752 domain-containing protein n=1 Tax=Cellulosimicrobium sp. NPDC057862 TaxID=3346266 RepID=UPI003670A5E9